MPQHCASISCCESTPQTKEWESHLHIHNYLKGETWWSRNFSLKLSLNRLHSKVLNPLYVPMFILYPFRSAFDHCWRPLCRAFCVTNDTGSIQRWAPGKATGSIQTLHRARGQSLPANICWSMCHLIFTLIITSKCWHMLLSHFQFAVCEGLLGTRWEQVLPKERISNFHALPDPSSPSFSSLM